MKKDVNATSTTQLSQERKHYPDHFRGSHRLTAAARFQCADAPSCFFVATRVPRAVHLYWRRASRPDADVEKFPVRYEIDTLRCITAGCRRGVPRATRFGWTLTFIRASGVSIAGFLVEQKELLMHSLARAGRKGPRTATVNEDARVVPKQQDAAVLRSAAPGDEDLHQSEAPKHYAEAAGPYRRPHRESTGIRAAAANNPMTPSGYWPDPGGPDRFVHRPTRRRRRDSWPATFSVTCTGRPQPLTLGGAWPTLLRWPHLARAERMIQQLRALGGEKQRHRVRRRLSYTFKIQGRRRAWPRR